MHWVQRVGLIYLGGIVLAVWGYGVGEHHWWPYKLVREISEFVKGDPEEAKTSVFQKLQNDLGGHPYRKLIKYEPKKQHPKREYKTLTLLKKNTRRQDPLLFMTPDATKGLRLIYGSFDHQKGLNGALLLSAAGELLWEWVVTEEGLPWRLIANEERKFPHGILVQDDGSLIFTFDNGMSLQKFDRCSNRVWAEKAKVDHSLHRDPQGHIWAVMAPNSLGQFDGNTGKIRKRINMNRLLKANPKIDPLGIRQIDYANKSRWTVKGGGYWHPNDVEPLPKEYASAFPQFEPGDLLVSFRSINLVFVVAPKTLKIKWWRSGAWRRQHDPDWQPNGTITVFNNNMHNDVSSIVQIDPKTFKHETLFNGVEEHFYTWMRGKHEVLENGHIAISSPQQGRVFEVNKEGEVVFEFVNRYDNEYSMLVSELLTFPTNYFQKDAFSPCPKTRK